MHTQVEWEIQRAKQLDQEKHRSFWARAFAEYQKGTQYLFTRKEIQKHQEYLNGFRPEGRVEQMLELDIEDKTEVTAGKLLRIA